MRPRALTGLLAALAAAAAAALVLAAGGCGSSATLDPVAQAADTTTQAGGAHLAFTASITANGLPSAVTASGAGFFNYASREGSLTLAVSGLPTDSAGGSLSIRELFKSGTAYVGSPLLAGRLPGGARWVKLGLARAAQSFGLSPQTLSGGGANPAQFLEFLKAASGGVTRVGAETVRGVPTTRYRATIDLSKVAGVLPSAERGATGASLGRLIAQTGLHDLPVEVWVDAHGLARRIALSLSLSSQGQSLRAAFTVDLFGFGPTPPVQPPAPGETYELSSSSLGSVAAGG